MNLQVMDDLSWIGAQSPENVLSDALASWPSEGWYEYDSPHQKKRTLSDWKRIPPPCRRLLSLLACQFHDGMIPDLGLWGAGLAEMRPGDFLGEHLDHDVHPHLGRRRHHNAILFLGGDGDLVIGKGDSAVRIKPAFGRVCLFDTTEDSWHHVPTVKELRRTLSVYFYDPRAWIRPEAGRRHRAAFSGDSIHS